MCEHDFLYVYVATINQFCFFKSLEFISYLENIFITFNINKMT